MRAADRVVVEEDIFGMTLESVAREAEVSKGGLLYHFRVKEALIDASSRALSYARSGAQEGQPRRLRALSPTRRPARVFPRSQEFAPGVRPRGRLMMVREVVGRPI